MVEFAEGLGWRFMGWCGCTPKKRIYSHPEHPDHQLWIGNNVFEIRKKYSSVDLKVLGRGGINNYQTVYEYWINK